MATITLTSALPSYQWWPSYFEPSDTSRITLATATTLRWSNGDGTTVEMKGTGFTYNSEGNAIEGALNSIAVRDGGATLMAITKVNGTLSEFFDWAFGFTRGGQEPQPGDGYNFMTAILRGNDTIEGSNNGDDIAGGRNSGNDAVNGNGGDDFIKGDSGRDVIDGGGDFDTLTYQESFYDPAAFQGITVNMALRTIIDCWGSTDTFSSIEQIQGSKFRDTFIGAEGDDRFHGLRGKDVFEGGGGFDEIIYWKDSEFGGTRGIAVNLATGKITDGWGHVDTVTGIESVVGTSQADSFTGGASDDQFLGGVGRDTYDGGGGRDTVNFSWGNASTGAVVNLALATGQVLNDGYGNAETLISIERLDGNELNDSFLGRTARDELVGDRGDDTLNGKGGDDFIAGDAGLDILTGGSGKDEFHFNRREGNDPWGDTITDFQSGADRITISTQEFAGMDSTLRFVNGTAAGGTGSWFFFNAVNNGLFWDADGSGSGAAIRVATLTGVNRLQANDIELFV